MKDAFYVPDALWNAASDLYPTDGTSALVQRGLRALIASWEGTKEHDELIEAVGREVIFGADDA